MRTVRALCKDGHLLPLEPLGFQDGQEITISVPEVTESRPACVAPDEGFGRYAHLVGLFPPDVMDQMERDIEEAFGKVEEHG